tara:strand:- start:393 stop:788 length:396 start_codon:yes stop_codon:yes gene_type:complete
MKKDYKAMVLSCMDPRFQPKVFKYLRKKKLTGKYSSFTIAGAAIGVTARKFKTWHSTFWQNLETSIRLHKIKMLIVLNHQDCGAAKIINGKKKFNLNIEKKIHEKSFKLIRQKLKKKFPKITIETKIMSLK